MRKLAIVSVVGLLTMPGFALAVAPESQPATELRPILSAEQKREEARKLIDRFISHVTERSDLPAQARSAVVDGWKQHRTDEEPEDFLQAGLAIISEPFKSGLVSLEKEQYATAVAEFQKLAESPDPYLSLNARGLQARAHVEQDQLEEAEKILKPLAEKEAQLIDKTFLETEVDFLLAYCQLSNLRYDEALESLQQFEYEHPDAPDRFRLPAHQMLSELKARSPDGLGDVSDLMVYSSRRLANGEPGPQVQVPQEKAVELLTRLIAQAEEREQQQKSGGKGCKQCQGKGCNKCQGGNPKGAWQPKSPANKSALPGGPGQVGDLNRSPNARPGEEWGQMRPEERERVLQSLRRTFPSRYRQLVEQYYKQLAKEK